jgi:hypothetical protein
VCTLLIQIALEAAAQNVSADNEKEPESAFSNVSTFISSIYYKKKIFSQYYLRLSNGTPSTQLLSHRAGLLLS